MNTTSATLPTAPVQIAAVQMVSSTNVRANLAQAGELIAQAAAGGAQIVLLPENFYFMGAKDTDKVALREALGDGPIQSCLSNAARTHRVWLVGGTVPLVSPEPGRVLNTALVFDSQGQQVERYDKIHLFSFTKGEEQFNEARTIWPGEQTCGFASPAGRVGLSICYDLRFPELYRALGDCALMMVTAAFTYTTGRAHWELLLRARAVENQCYVLAAAQGGKHENGRSTWGHSMLIDPWGEIVAELAEGPGVVLGKVDPARITEIRQSLPALQHRVLR